jgi:hypothetical protein
VNAIQLHSPMELHTRNQQAITAVREVVQTHYMNRIQGRAYLMVAGAQAIATALGYTTGIESVRHIPATDDLPGYWEATATVMQSGQVVGRGVAAVFDDERPWNTRPHFARQAMAQTRATGRALKGVMGWACAMIGAETSLAEEMPQEGATVPQDGTEGVKRLPARPAAPKAPKGNSGATREIRGICAGVKELTSKAGKPYWRIALEGEPGKPDPEWTSFKSVPDMAGRMVKVVLESKVNAKGESGDIAQDVIDLEVD